MALPTLIANYNRINFSKMPTKDAQSEADIMQATLTNILALVQIQLIAQYLSMLPQFVNFHDEATFKAYFPVSLPSVPPRGSIDHEIHAYVIRLIRKTQGARVCDIGCGSGLLGLFFAFAGAHVTLNDNNPRAIAKLRDRLQTLPARIQGKCSIIEGNCLDLLMSHSNLKKRMDFVFCRSLLDLLSLSDQIKLFETVKEMLKPDGQAIFVTNSIYSWRNILPKDCEREDEQASACFHVQNAIVEKPDLSGSSTILYSSFQYCTEEMFSLQATEHTIYSKSADTDGKWKPTSKKIEHTVVPGALLQKVQQTMKNPEVNAFLKEKYWPGRIKVRLSYAHFYNVNNLPRLVRAHGFDVLSTVIIDRWGHLIHNPSKRFEEGQQIAVIVTPNK